MRICGTLYPINSPISPLNDLLVFLCVFLVNFNLFPGFFTKLTAAKNSGQFQFCAHIWHLSQTTNCLWSWILVSPLLSDQWASCVIFRPSCGWLSPQLLSKHYLNRGAENLLKSKIGLTWRHSSSRRHRPLRHHHHDQKRSVRRTFSRWQPGGSLLSHSRQLLVFKPLKRKIKIRSLTLLLDWRESAILGCIHTHAFTPSTRKLKKIVKFKCSRAGLTYRTWEYLWNGWTSHRSTTRRCHCVSWSNWE